MAGCSYRRTEYSWIATVTSGSRTAPVPAAAPPAELPEAAPPGYFEGESDALPAHYENRIRRGLGRFFDALPPGALAHDQNAYLHSQEPKPRRAAG